MKSVDQTIGVQLKALVESGLPVEDAAASLDLDPEAALDYINGLYSQKEVTAEDLIKKYRPAMIQVLADIALDTTCENTSARVAAARVFVTGEGVTPELPVDKLSETYKKMRAVIEKQHTTKPATITNPSPSTTIVEVAINNKGGVVTPPPSDGKPPSAVSTSPEPKSL